jgi:RimJ/RimL family protein N-acetyltransferase
MSPKLRAGELDLHPLTAGQAHDVVRTDRLPQPLRAGAGWPHADSYDGLRLATDHSYLWLVTLADVVIGDCGTLGGVDDDGDIEIGYGLAEPYRRHGYGGMLVRPLTDFLLSRPGIRRVVAGTRPENRPSYRILERAGFRRTRATDAELRYAFP